MVERRGDAAVTTFHVLHVVRNEIHLGEEDAHHARVKRLAVGDPVDVTDGMGGVGSGRIKAIEKRGLILDIDRTSFVERPPEINLFVPLADKERMLWLAEKATELQVTSWNPVMYERSKSVSPRGEGEAFDRKVFARMLSALGQSGGAWLPGMNQQVLTVADLRDRKGIVLERDGQPLGQWAAVSPVNLAIGPEGGFTDEEVNTLLDAGWSAASIGDVTLRFETAAIAAVAIVRSMLH